jgi:outer membrane receptor protein involved in Fe transport
VGHDRLVGRASGAVEAGLGPFELVPSVIGLAVSAPDAGGWRVLAAPRIGARAGGGAGGDGAWTVRANAGATARPPDVTELYGDRGALVGNPELRPERGVQLDLGPAWEVASARVELVGFFARYRDLIAWTLGPQGIARPENLARADVGGLELAAEAGAGPVQLEATGALIRAANRSPDPVYAGNQLPRIPALSGTATVSLVGPLGPPTASLAPGPLRLALDAAFTAGTWADTANQTRQPPRALLGADLEARDRSGRLAVELDVRNLLDTISWRVPRDPVAGDLTPIDAAVVDYAGQPLPGRTFTLSLRLDGAAGSAPR